MFVFAILPITPAGLYFDILTLFNILNNNNNNNNNDDDDNNNDNINDNNNYGNNYNNTISMEPRRLRPTKIELSDKILRYLVRFKSHNLLMTLY